MEMEMEMMSVSEEAHSRRVRVFRWNEKLRKNGVSDCEALFMLCITNKFITINPNNNKHQEQVTQRMSNTVVKFERTRVLSDDSIKSLALDAVHATNQFLPNTVLSLAPQISTYLISRFCFSPQNLLRRNLPRIVIVVEIDRTRTVDYGCSSTSSDPIPSFPPSSPSPEGWWHSSDDEIDEELLINDHDTYEDPEYNWDEDPELFHIMYTVSYKLGEPGKYPLKPIATNEPIGFFEVDPEKDHVWLRMTKDNDPAEKGRSTAVGMCPIGLDTFRISNPSCIHSQIKRNGNNNKKWMSNKNSKY